MGSSVTDATNLQQEGQKRKDKTNKDVMGLLKERLREVNASISTLTGRVEDIEKRIKKLESEVGMDELRREM